MKKYVWIVIAVVLLFLAMIIAYTMSPTPVAGKATSAVEKPH